MNAKLTFLFLFVVSRVIFSAEAPQRFLPDNIRTCISKIITCGGVPTAMQRCRENGTCAMCRCYCTGMCGCSKRCFCKSAKIAGLVCVGTGSVGSICYFVSSVVINHGNISSGMRR